MKVLILYPRLDISFKGSVGDYVPIEIGPPNANIRYHWVKFVENLIKYHQNKGDSISVLHKPLWQFTVEETDGYNADVVYVPHKDVNSFPAKNARYYMQTVFPEYFTVDKRAWGAGLSFLDELSGLNKNGWYFDTKYLSKSVREIVGILPSKEVVDDWFHKFKSVYTVKSKFEQPQSSSNFPYKDYYLFICQIPHDEVIKLYSQRTPVDGALKTTIAFCETVNKKLLVKGHPVNLGSMVELKKITEASKISTWVDIDVNIHDCIKNSDAVFTCNSGSGFEVILHEKPLITFGYAEYDKICLKNPTLFKSALENLFHKNKNGFDTSQYKDWLYWFIHKIVDGRDLNTYNNIFYKCPIVGVNCTCNWPSEDCKYTSIKKELWPSA